ncbi:hypothetical protein TNCV_1026671 [Trichonephila clavipes]|nr:hypothetical protein TNCV_1026671 [Trichonephila clavipes]
MVYRHTGSRSVKNIKTLMSATKVMLTIFSDTSGELYTEFLTKGLTANSDSAQTQDVLEKLKFTVVPQLPYSPDLALSNFWLFPKLKETLKGRRFQRRKKFRQSRVNGYASNQNLSSWTKLRNG